MSHRFLIGIAALTAVVLIALLAPVLVAGQQAPGAAAKWTPARTPWGDPDLQGVYTFATNTPLERPKEFAGKAEYTEAELAEAQKKLDDAASRRRGNIAGIAEPGKVTRSTSLVIDPEDGLRSELTPQGTKIRDEIEAERQSRRFEGQLTYDKFTQHDFYTRCIARPMPRTKQAYNHGVQILQTPGQVVVHYESMRDVRVIPLDGRPHLPDSLRQFNGDSRGRWEGNTLVVDWTNFHPAQRWGPGTTNDISKVIWRDGVETDGNGEWGGLPQGNMRITERFTKVDANTIEYMVTIDDPVTYKRPWTIALPWRSDDPIYQNPEDLLEYACHEGNYRMWDNALSGSRTLRKRASEGQTGR
jgi:hypothetical protein